MLTSFIVTSHGPHGVSLQWPPECFFQQFVWANIKETSMVGVTGPLWRESTGDRWIPPQRASNAGSLSISWHHHVIRLEGSVTSLWWFHSRYLSSNRLTQLDELTFAYNINMCGLWVYVNFLASEIFRFSARIQCLHYKRTEDTASCSKPQICGDEECLYMWND